MNAGTIYFTLGIRCFYFAGPLALWVCFKEGGGAIFIIHHYRDVKQSGGHSLLIESTHTHTPHLHLGCWPHLVYVCSNYNGSGYAGTGLRPVINYKVI